MHAANGGGHGGGGHGGGEHGSAISLDEQFPNVRRWYDLCKQRPGLRRGYQVGREHGKPGQMDPKAKEILLGQKPAAGEAGPGN